MVAATTKKSALEKVQIKAPSKKVAAAAAAAAAAVVAAAAASKRPDSDIGRGDSRIHRLLRRHAIQSADSAAFEELRVIGRAIVNQLLLGAALVTTAHSHMMIDVGDVREAAQHTLGVRVAGATDLAYPVKDVKALTDKQKAVRANRLANLQRGRDVSKAKKAAAAAAAARRRAEGAARRSESKVKIEVFARSVYARARTFGTRAPPTEMPKSTPPVAATIAKKTVKKSTTGRRQRRRTDSDGEEVGDEQGNCRRAARGEAHRGDEEAAGGGAGGARRGGGGACECDEGANERPRRRRRRRCRYW